MSSKLAQVENVRIDGNGCFKYILVKINDGSHQKYIVRGHGRAGYHGMTPILITKYYGINDLCLGQVKCTVCSCAVD